jgi:hypothetical protein
MLEQKQSVGLFGLQHGALSALLSFERSAVFDATEALNFQRSLWGVRHTWSAYQL